MSVSIGQFRHVAEQIKRISDITQDDSASGNVLAFRHSAVLHDAGLEVAVVDYNDADGNFLGEVIHVVPLNGQEVIGPIAQISALDDFSGVSFRFFNDPMGDAPQKAARRESIFSGLINSIPIFRENGSATLAR